MVCEGSSAKKIRPSAKLLGGHPLLLGGVGLDRAWKNQTEQNLSEYKRPELNTICA
jgi:hypothetical protein